MKLSEELEARGSVHQTSAKDLSEVVDGERRVVYHGIDPTADSAHAGNFVAWMLLRRLIDGGHKVVFLVGGGTGMIGDPKPDQERTLASREVIAERVEKIKNQAQRLLGEEVEFVDNYDWLSTLNLIEFLRDIGKHFTVNELIKKDAIATRLQSEVGLSYTEFAYPLLQAFDYLQLHTKYGCDVQVGGSDQWGNIVAGVDLVRRKSEKKVYALTTPLVVDKATGKKFGKSEGNAVWLDADKTSPFEFYQFWFNVSDESVIEYLKLFTMMSLEEIQVLESQAESDPGSRVAQRALAEAVTSFVHGKVLSQASANVSKLLFGEGDVMSLTAEEQHLLKTNAPLFKIAKNTPLSSALVESGLASSKREARTFLQGGAIVVGSEKVGEDVEVGSFNQSLLLLRRGKKNVCVIELL